MTKLPVAEFASSPRVPNRLSQVWYGVVRGFGAFDSGAVLREELLFALLRKEMFFGSCEGESAFVSFVLADWISCRRTYLH